MTVGKELQSRIAYTTACVTEFAKRKGMKMQEAYRYLSDHGGLRFLEDHYEIEHTLSFDDVIDDLEIICARNDEEMPNEETILAMKEAEAMINDPNARMFNSVDELFAELES